MQQLKKYGIVIHGGAGSLPFKLPLWYENEEKKALKNALDLGFSKLENNYNALDAVETAVKIMEDSPFFNAGKGAAKNELGDFEMDAGIMDGSTMKSGAIGCAKFIKNPIVAAKKILENSKYNLLAGAGAEKFAKEQGCQFVEQSYFDTDELKEKLRQSVNQEKNIEQKINENKHGTVGAVALDKFGKLAAATSTGGMSKKLLGRIGDSPIIGHGNYANKQCAISATGKGEKIMSAVMTFDIAAYMEYKQSSLQNAANYILFEKYKQQFGPKATAGIIAIDNQGNFCFPFSTQVMDRAVKLSDGTYALEIY